MTRVKALYRGWGIACAGQQVYALCHRAEWLDKIGEAGVRRRDEFFYQQLDALRALRQPVRKDLLAESQKHGGTKLLREIPAIGPIRAALLIALMQTPHRFRTKRQLWSAWTWKAKWSFGQFKSKKAKMTVKPNNTYVLRRSRMSSTGP